MPIMPARVNRVPRLGQPAQSWTPVADAEREQIRQRIANAGKHPADTVSTYGIPGGSMSSSQEGMRPQGGAFGAMPGTPGSRVRNFPAKGTGVLAGANGVRNQESLNAGQGVFAIPTQQPSYVSRPAENPFPYEHDYGTGNSRAFDVSMQNLRDRQRAANSLLQRNIGAGGYGGIGGMSDGAAARQAELINPMIAANQLQQQRNNYGSWERGQLRLGGAKQPDIVQAQGAPQLPATSQFSPPREGYTENENGGTVVRSGSGARLIGSALSNKFDDAALYARGELVPGSLNYANAKRSLDALTSQAENARIAAQTAAGGGLSRAGQYDQRQKDIKALRYAKQRPTSIAFSDAMSRLKQRQAVQAQQLAAITGQPAVRSAPTVVNTPQVQATMQTVPNPVFNQDPFGMPGRIPPRQQQYPTTYWSALQSMLYGNNPAHGGNGNYGR